MAWTLPTTPYFTVGEVVSAAKMNVLSDDLRYLKGADGAVTINNLLGANLGGVSSTDILSALSGGSGNFAGLGVGRSATEARFFVPSAGGQFLAGAVAGDAGFRVDDSAKKILIGAGATETVTITSSAMGVGTASPQGKLHALGGNVTTAVFLLLSAVAVTSLQTLTAAGTISRAAYFLGIDRQNTSTGPNSFAGVATVGTNFTYTNGDTITVAITAGGAISVQRTTGTAGTHDINMIVIGF